MHPETSSKATLYAEENGIGYVKLQHFWWAGVEPTEVSLKKQPQCPALS